MTYTALARKYRPRRFTDLVAQDHVARALGGAVVRDRVAHGYLFAGPRGVGKTTAARVLAMALNCAQRDTDGEPCGTCESCRRVWLGAANLDVVEIDAASNRGVDDARELRERAMYAASTEDRSKVYIIDEAHMLTREAWNALLKILEEPPPRVVFVFATTEPQKIAQSAAPVLSRLQRFDFRRLSEEKVADRLRSVADAEGISAEDDALQLIASNADGGMRDALSVLDQILAFGEDQVTVSAVRSTLGLVPDELYRELLQIVVDREPARVFDLVDRVVASGGDLMEFVRGAGDMMRAILMRQSGAAAPEMTGSLKNVVETMASAFAPEDALQLLDLLLEAEERMRHGSTRLAVEMLLLKWAMLDRLAVVADALQTLGREEGQPPDRGDRGPAPPPAEQRPGPPAAPEVMAHPPADAPRAAEHGPFTLDRLRDEWPAVIDRLSASSPFLSRVLAGASIAEANPPLVVVELDPDAALHQEGIERQRHVIENQLRALVESPVTVQVRSAAVAAEQSEPARPERLTEESARAERFKVLRAKDPALEEAAKAFDLELLD